MSMRDLLAGYAVTMALFVFGCLVIERNAPGLKGIRWLKIAFSTTSLGLVLAICRSHLPPVLTIVLPHVAIFSALVLIHQAINDVLDLNKRYLPFGIVLGLADLAGLVFFTTIHPNLDMRIYLLDTADALQAGLTVVVLFGCRNAALRSPIRTTGYLVAGIGTVHLLRIAETIAHPPQIDMVQLGSPQAFFVFSIFILGLGYGLSVIWLSFCAQRNRLQALALTDGLTGLLNRRAFEEALHRELNYAQRSGKSTGLILIDLDFFKSINDVHGHPAGDEVIRRVSSALQTGARGSDALARFGGEEFIVMLRDTDPLQASMIAERMRQQVASLRGLPDGVRTTASIGVAVSSPFDTPDSLLKNADDALYASKRAGRNTVSCYQDPLSAMLPHTQPQPELLPTRIH